MPLKAKTTLDIGCGAGIFVDCLKSLGYNAYGLELSDWGYKTAQWLGLPVIQKDYININKSDHLPIFDIISMYDILEHSTNIENGLKKLLALLSNDGYLIVNVPNFASLMSKSVGKQWNKLIPPDHTLYFTKKTLSNLLEANGFEVISINTNNGSPSETIAELAAALWKIPGKVFKPINEGYKNKDKPRDDARGFATAVKATQKIFYRFGFLAYLLFPIIDLFQVGEGIHIVAKRV